MMSLLYVKSVIAVFFMAAGVLAFICMLTLMGRSEGKVSPGFLRTTHRIAGVAFTVLLAVLSYMCVKLVVGLGDQLSLRAVLHSVLALGLIIVLIIKILIVQYYRKLMVYVPALGMIVFALAFMVFFTSAGYYFLRSAGAEARLEELTEAPRAEITGDADNGRVLFDNKCSFCHSATTEEPGIGPGLKGIMKKESLPYGGKPATAANVLEQLKSPVGMMPSFASLSDQELYDLIAFMKTL